MAAYAQLPVSDAQNAQNLFVSMYDKLFVTLKVAAADSSLLDLYTLSDFVSVLLCVEIKSTANFKTQSIHANRLKAAIAGLGGDDVLAAFFDGDKTYYGGLNLTRAMATAGFTPEEQALFARRAVLVYAPRKRQEEEYDNYDEL